MSFTLLLLLGLICLTSRMVLAVEDDSAAVEAGLAAEAEAAAAAAAAASSVTPEADAETAKRAKQEKRAAAKKKKRSMQSCLTLVRSYYGREDAFIQSFMEEHPTMDKNRLLSKILS